MARLDNKVILVTGTSSGMGWDAAKTFANEGATVIAAARRPERGEQLVDQITQNGGRCVYRQTDISDEQSLGELFAFIAKDYGRLDGAFNNAAVEAGPSPLPDMPLKEYDRVFSTNARGTWHCMHHEMKIMREQGSGSILNTSSAAAVKTYPNSSAYVASKHAVVGMSKAAALDGATFGVRVNCILPGGIRTEMIEGWIESRHGGDETPITAEVPLRRIGEPAEITSAAVWLLSDESSYVTGVSLLVDGGLTVG